MSLSKKLNQVNGSKVVQASLFGDTGYGLKLLFEKGDTKLLIWAMWRLAKGSQVLTGGDGDRTLITGAAAVGAARLIDETLIAVSVNEFYDIHMVFSNDLILDVFCDLTPDMPEPYVNWRINFQQENITYVVTYEFEVVSGKYLRPN